MNPSGIRWHRYEGREALDESAALAIAEFAADCISRHGTFVFVAAGGDTPTAAYRRLAGMAQKWAAWHVYFGDERCLPAGHAQRNSTMLDEALLSRVAIPREQILPIPAELGPEQGALAYRSVVDRVSTFDLVLLGLGEDGHVASLFPGMDIGGTDDAPSVLPVRKASKFPPERVSLSSRRLRQSKRILCLVAGEAKRAAVAAWRRGDEQLPAAQVASGRQVDVLVDATAWG